MKHLNPANQSGPGNRRFSLVFLLLSTVFPSLVEADIVINELMARNRGAHTNGAGDDRADWIELHNNGALPVDLTGWHLSDDTSNFSKWTFPTAKHPRGRLPRRVCRQRYRVGDLRRAARELRSQRRR
jgi:hypothetical protein